MSIMVKIMSILNILLADFLNEYASLFPWKTEQFENIHSSLSSHGYQII